MIGKDNPEEEQLFQDLWEDDTQREIVLESLKTDREVRVGRGLRGFERQAHADHKSVSL
jgi:hypothetical protein